MTTAPLAGRCVALFVPATRPERFAKALASGADVVFVDLEDAVAVAEKDAARAALEHGMPPGGALYVRVNAAGTPWHADDLALVRRLPVAGVVLPKAERAEDIAAVVAAAGRPLPVVALVESAAGIAEARRLAAAPGVVRLAFGSIDFAADIGSAHTREALLAARSELVLAARLAGLPGPIDGVTAGIADEAAAEDDAAYAAGLGFTGKLCIHPRQVAPVARGLAPSAEEIAWAERIVAALDRGGAVVTVDGAMVDAPVRLRAERILARAAPATR